MAPNTRLRTHLLIGLAVGGLIGGGVWAWGRIRTASFGPVPVPPPMPAVGGDYGPVTATDLVGRHEVFATGGSGARLVWEFTADGFVLTGDGGPIPAEVRLALLGEDWPADRIAGRWTLGPDGLALSQLTADDTGGFPAVVLRPFRTPVVRVHFGSTQYVLGRGR